MLPKRTLQYRSFGILTNLCDFHSLNFKIMNKLTALILGMALTFNACSKDDDEINTSSSNEKLLEQIKADLDGYKIAFGDTKNIYMMDPDGKNVEKLADASPISGYVSWSQDAKYVYYASSQGPAETAWEAWRVNVKTKQTTKLSNFGNDVRSLGVSPDGKTLAISVMTGNSNIGDNNDNLTQFSTNLYVVSMSTVEAKINVGDQIKMADLKALQSSPNSDQFWYEELSWNHDASNPILAYSKTWKYDEDEVSYTHSYTIKPDGTQNTLIAKNQDQPIWSIDNTKLSFLGLDYYNYSDKSMKKINVSGIKKELSGGSFSPKGGTYMIFEVGDENRKGGISQTTESNNTGIQLQTIVDVYEPRWSPKIVE